MFEGSDSGLNTETVASKIYYKSFKTQNLPFQNSYCDHRNFDNVNQPSYQSQLPLTPSNYFIPRTWLTKQKMTAFLVGSWLDAAIVSVLPFFWRKGTEDEPCIYDPTREWSLMVIGSNVFTPFLIMLFCHIYTVSYALRYSRKLKMELLAKGNNPTSPHYNWQPTSELRDKNSLKRERDITR